MKLTVFKLAPVAGALLLLATSPIQARSNLETLGGAIYNDLNLSINQNQSCKTCHQQSAGFADPENRVMPHQLPTSDGSIPALFGGRNAPTAAYAGFSPKFHYDKGEELFIGGLFWDGRATGRDDITATGGLGDGPTGDPLADQAKGPFGNPVEMALTDSTEEQVMAIIQASDYADKFAKEFPGSFVDTAADYQNVSIAIAAFERSDKVNKFSSKFDDFVKEQGGDVSTFGVVTDSGVRVYVGPPDGFKSKVFSYDEADGLAIFNADSFTQIGSGDTGSVNGGQCYLCHLTDNHKVDVTDENYPENGPAEGIYNPIFTDFSYDNLGIPVNPQVAVNAGSQEADKGLGGQTAQLDAAFGSIYSGAADLEGAFKVSSLRNLSRTAPYSHNGYFSTIYEIVHFYNTRDIKSECPQVQVVDADGELVNVNMSAQAAIANNCWPVGEFAGTQNTDELGNLGMTLEQEMKLVQFMETLND